MADYTQITDFSAKDALALGNPAKIIKGVDVDGELDAVSTAIASKADSDEVVLLTGAQTVAGVKTFSSAPVCPAGINLSTPITLTGSPTAAGAATWSNLQTFSAGITLGGPALHAQGANLASATTVNLATATGNAVTITGTTAITAFGTVQAGALFVLTFADALTLTYNATSLILPGAANLMTAAGDVAVMLSLGSGNWRCVNYFRAAASARIVQRVEGTPYTTYTNHAVAVPQDDTIPQSSEGVEYVTVTITPRKSTNRLKIYGHASAVSLLAAGAVTAALFQDAGANALAVTGVRIDAVNAVSGLTVYHEMAAGTTSATTFRLRIGPDSGGTVHINGINATGRVYGGISAVRLWVEEYDSAVI